MSEHSREPLELGAFSVSLAVKDVVASQSFYEKLGFSAIGGDATQNWLIMRNGTTTIGLFQGMFERNILTFNPGWNAACEALPNFTDIRALQAHFEQQGLTLQARVESGTSGPGSLIVVDPDGNPIMLDQHV